MKENKKIVGGKVENGFYDTNFATCVVLNNEITHEFKDIDYLINEYILEKDFKEFIDKNFADYDMLDVLRNRHYEFWNRKPKEFDKISYRNYLQTKKWKEKRRAKLDINDCCEICGSKGNLHIHHKTYKNIFDEKLEDLQTLCKDCHLSIHRQYKIK